ncbi:MAG: DNA polymerase III subunit delta [Thermodesulfobacteriota bacterium]
MKYTRHDLPSLLAELDKGSLRPVYLLFGERYLCAQAAQEIIGRLLPDQASRQQNMRAVDGDQEVVSQTINELRTFSLFGGRQVIRVLDSRLFHSKAVGKSIWDKALKAHNKDDQEKAGRYLAQLAGLGGLDAEDKVDELSAGQWKKLFGFAKPQDVAWTKGISLLPGDDGPAAPDNAALVQNTLEKGVPEKNHLVLVAETVDKRKKLFKTIDEIGVIVDLSVDTGAATAARKDQDAVIRDLVNQTFDQMGKKPGPRVLEMVLDRVGFHPVAAVREAEKLCLYCDEAPVVTSDDVNAVTGQTREEALFELNDAFASRDLNRSLYLQGRLLRAGLHPLVLISALRNLIRRLLFLRALQDKSEPSYCPGQAYNVFQKGYLTAIKEALGDNEFLKGHPFVVYKGFQQAEGFSRQELINGLTALLLAEFKLKGSGIRESLILENFFFSMLV